ncbi:MAG: FHA domain-containing protein, partial [Actinomycetes bacterium]
PILHVVSLSVIGIAIGFATGLVELARRQAWIRIVGGGMTGKEFIVYHEVTNVGSSPKSEVTLLKDPAVAPFHCRIVDQQNQRVLQAFDGCAVTINGAPISQQTLRNGDMLQIGGTLIQYAERVPVA